MRVASKLVGLTLIALAPAARAQGPGAPNAAPPPVAVAPAPVVALPPTPAASVIETEAPPPPAAWQRRFDVMLSFLPMEAGQYTTPLTTTMVVQSDASFAYGVSLSANVRLIRGLSVGVAPQIIWNVQPKVSASQLGSTGADKEADLMVRVAYTQPLADGIAVYGEVLPGYSFLMPPTGKLPKGMVLALGAGIAMDLSQRFFLDIGGGYQFGFQSLSVSGESASNHVRYIRLTLGGGVRF